MGNAVFVLGDVRQQGFPVERPRVSRQGRASCFAGQLYIYPFIRRCSSRQRCVHHLRFDCIDTFVILVETFQCATIKLVYTYS